VRATLSSAVMRIRNRLAMSLVSTCALAAPSGVSASDSILACLPMPAIVHAEQAHYPDRESRVTIEGTVTLQFTITRDGSVTHPAVVANDPADTADWFNGPALEAIAKYKFVSVTTPCIGRTKIAFRVLKSAGAHNTSLERTRDK
jgi:TonB family protein